jgi:hypothetical protein
MRSLLKRRRLRLRLLVFALTSTVATLSVVAGVAISASAGSPPISVPIPGATSAVQAPSTAITAELAILSRSKTAADTLPAVVEESQWMAERLSGGNGALARRSRLSPQGHAVYLIPSQTGVCMLNTTGTENLCATANEVENGEANEAVLCAPVSLPTDEIEIGGILPDGVRNVAMVLSNGATVPLSVEGNTYIADVSRSSALPTEIEWDSAGGQHHVASTHVPSGVAKEDCVAPPGSGA